MLHHTRQPCLDSIILLLAISNSTNQPSPFVLSAWISDFSIRIHSRCISNVSWNFHGCSPKLSHDRRWDSTTLFPHNCSETVNPAPCLPRDANLGFARPNHSANIACSSKGVRPYFKSRAQVHVREGLGERYGKGGTVKAIC